MGSCVSINHSIHLNFSVNGCTIYSSNKKLENKMIIFLTLLKQKHYDNAWHLIKSLYSTEKINPNKIRVIIEANTTRTSIITTLMGLVAIYPNSSANALNFFVDKGKMYI